MCRRNYLHGCCIAAFGVGLLVGHCLDNGFVCFAVGMGLLLLGLGVMRKK